MTYSLGKNFLRLAAILGCFCASLESPETCENSALAWGDACQITEVSVIENATAWWYEKIYPFIPEEEKEFYQEPFGGATQPSAYRRDLVNGVLDESNEQGITYRHGYGGRDVGSRAPIHRHDLGATTHVLQGYVTLFLEGAAPTTAGPEESYYMPPGAFMTAAVVPKPVYNGKQIVQPDTYTRNLDINAFPTGRSVTIFAEREIVSEGEYFYWLTDPVTGDNAHGRSDEAPRYARQNDGFNYSEFFSTDIASDEESVTSSSTKTVLIRFSVVMAVFNFLVLVS